MPEIIQILEKIFENQYSVCLLIILILGGLGYTWIKQQKFEHDHKTCPNYETCQEIKTDLQNKADKKEFDDLQNEFKEVSKSIAVLTYAMTQSSKVIDSIDHKLNDLITKLIERR